MQLELSFYRKMSKSYKYTTGSEIGREKVSNPHFINKLANAWEVAFGQLACSPVVCEQECVPKTTSARLAPHSLHVPRCACLKNEPLKRNVSVESD